MSWTLVVYLFSSSKRFRAASMMDAVGMPPGLSISSSSHCIILSASAVGRKQTQSSSAAVGKIYNQPLQQQKTEMTHFCRRKETYVIKDIFLKISAVVASVQWYHRRAVPLLGKHTSQIINPAEAMRFQESLNQGIVTTFLWQVIREFDPSEKGSFTHFIFAVNSLNHSFRRRFTIIIAPIISRAKHRKHSQGRGALFTLDLSIALVPYARRFCNTDLHFANVGWNEGSYMYVRSSYFSFFAYTACVCFRNCHRNYLVKYQKFRQCNTETSERLARGNLAYDYQAHGIYITRLFECSFSVNFIQAVWQVNQGSTWA